MKTRGNITDEKHFLFLPYQYPRSNKNNVTIWMLFRIKHAFYPRHPKTYPFLTIMIRNPHKLSQHRTPWITWTTRLTTSPRIKFNNLSFCFSVSSLWLLFWLAGNTRHDAWLQMFKAVQLATGDMLAEDSLGLYSSSAYCQEYTYEEATKLD